MIMRTVNIKNEEETKKFGLKIAENAKPGDVYALIGDLGTGKTTLTKYIAWGLGIKGPVVSPTFNIVKEYTDGRIPLYHFDVYRLEEEEELYEIGAEEYFYEKGGICIVEWADKFEEMLPDTAKYIYIEQGEEPEERIYQCTF